MTKISDFLTHGRCKPGGGLPRGCKNSWITRANRRTQYYSRNFFQLKEPFRNAGSCPSGYKRLPPNGKVAPKKSFRTFAKCCVVSQRCYKLVKDQLTLDGAAAACTRECAFLVEPRCYVVAAAACCCCCSCCCYSCSCSYCSCCCCCMLLLLLLLLL